MPAATNWRHQRIPAHIYRALVALAEDRGLGSLGLGPLDVVRRLEPQGYETIGVFARGETLRSAIFPELRLPVDQLFAP